MYTTEIHVCMYFCDVYPNNQDAHLKMRMFCRPKNAHPMRIFYRPAGFATNAHLKIRIGCAFFGIFYRPAGLQKMRI